jgi:hypothetical protein
VVPKEYQMSGKKRIILLLCLCALLGIAFAGREYYLDNIKLPELSPRQVVDRYFAALKNKEYKQAYELVSLQHYNDSFNQFIDRVSMYSPAMLLEAQDERIEKDRATVSLKIAVPMQFGLYSSDSDMDLVRIKREWKIIHP